MAHDQLARLRPSSCRRLGGSEKERTLPPKKIHSQRHALTISFSEKDKFFLWLSLCQSTGKKLDLLGQWTLKKRLAGATSEPIPSCPSCACDWEHLDVAALPGSCPAMGYMHFSCSHFCHLSLPLFLDSLINNGGFM